MEKSGDKGKADRSQGDHLQRQFSANPELNESGLRYERPSPHFNIAQMQMEAELQPMRDRLSRAATADNLGDVVQVTQEGLSSATGRDESLDRWVQLQYGAYPYSDAVARDGSAYESPSELRGSNMSGTGDGHTKGVSTQFNEAAKHERSADQLKTVQGDQLSTANREKLGAAIRGEQDRAQVARATAAQRAEQQQADRAKAIREAAALKQQRAQRSSAAKAIEFARHPMDAKSEAARDSFNKAAQGVQREQSQQQSQGQGSQMVQSQQPKPQLNMKGALAADVNREQHQQQMRTDDQAARQRNERAQRIQAAAKRKQNIGNSQGQGKGNSSGH